MLSDLWMRPDHDKIQQLIPEGKLPRTKRSKMQYYDAGWDMTSVGDLSLPSCDGVIAPEFCSGLAVVSRFPILEVPLTAHTYSYIPHPTGCFFFTGTPPKSSKYKKVNLG